MATPKSTVSTEIIPYIYRDVPAALDWLSRAFGFAETMRTATPNGGTQGEMTLDGQRIMMGQQGMANGERHESEMATQGILIYLVDVDAHYERAKAAGQR
jgi:PhnB protein